MTDMWLWMNLMTRNKAHQSSESPTPWSRFMVSSSNTSWLSFGSSNVSESDLSGKNITRMQNQIHDNHQYTYSCPNTPLNYRRHSPTPRTCPGSITPIGKQEITLQTRQNTRNTIYGILFRPSKTQPWSEVNEGRKYIKPSSKPIMITIDCEGRNEDKKNPFKISKCNINKK